MRLVQARRRASACAVVALQSLQSAARVLGRKLNNVVVAICLISLCAALLATMVADVYGVSLTTVSLWSLGALALFHLVLWGARTETTQNHLRALEYVYITIGLLGALTVVEIKSSLLE